MYRDVLSVCVAVNLKGKGVKLRVYAVIQPTSFYSTFQFWYSLRIALTGVKPDVVLLLL